MVLYAMHRRQQRQTLLCVPGGREIKTGGESQLRSGSSTYVPYLPGLAHCRETQRGGAAR